MLTRLGALMVITGALTLACGSSGNGTSLGAGASGMGASSAGASGTGGSGNSTSGSGSSQCVEDMPCDCKSGLTSFTKCDEQGMQSCDCESCPAFEPTASEAPFNACGGMPFGSWVLKSHDLSAVKGGFSYSNALTGVAATATCASQARELAKANMVLILRDGGTASVLRKNDSIAFSVLNSCLTDTLPVDCSAFKTCKAKECGICDCAEGKDDVARDDARWSTAAGTLTINAMTFATDTPDFGAAFDYCVDGDQLSLSEKGTGEAFVLARTNTFGVPSACATRTLDQCASDDSCSVGSCVGTDCPAATSEAACTNHAGCVWDKTVCSGNPKATCGIADYGVVPGCVQGDTPPHCAGDAAPCSADDAANGFSAEACMARTGCMPNPGCTGKYTADCTKDVLDCGSCAPGCTCTQDSFEFHCSGVSTCADQKTYQACFNMVCNWLDFASCEGTPPTCDSLSADACMGSPGCFLTAQ